VKKVYPRHKKNKPRGWRLRRMAKEEADVLPRKQDANRDELEYEQFLRDVEEDPDLRQTMNLYKAQQEEKRRKAREEAMEGVEMMDGVEEEEGDEVGSDDGLEVPLDQLIDEFDEMNMGS